MVVGGGGRGSACRKLFNVPRPSISVLCEVVVFAPGVWGVGVASWLLILLERCGGGSLRARSFFDHQRSIGLDLDLGGLPSHLGIQSIGRARDDERAQRKGKGKHLVLRFRSAWRRGPRPLGLQRATVKHTHKEQPLTEEEAVGVNRNALRAKRDLCQKKQLTGLGVEA